MIRGALRLLLTACDRNVVEPLPRGRHRLLAPGGVAPDHAGGGEPIYTASGAQGQWTFIYQRILPALR